jgi:hypothetical protein
LFLPLCATTQDPPAAAAGAAGAAARPEAEAEYDDYDYDDDDDGEYEDTESDDEVRTTTMLPFARAVSGMFNPFVRRLVHNMDSCSGTNKSQFCFGSLALLVMCGYLDQLELFFQLQGHTKFDPDVAAQKTAGAFNSSDTFNHGMLNDHFGAHVTAFAYDERDLLTWKEATPAIFEAVDHITQFRQFMLLVDDGKLSLGPPLDKARSDAKDFPGVGSVFSDDVLQREAKLAARRSLQERVLPSVHQRTHEGIGSGSGLFGPKTAELKEGYGACS